MREHARTAKPGSRTKRSRASKLSHLSHRMVYASIGVVVLGYLLLLGYFVGNPFSFEWEKSQHDVPPPSGFNVYGIDISHYQKHIDWDKLSNAEINNQPIRFIFIKATEGATQKDDDFQHNFEQARLHGFLRGAYHYFKPKVDAQQQAQNFIKQVELHIGDLPPVLDVEESGNLTNTELQSAILLWLTLVERQYGVKPIIYTGYKFKLQHLSTPIFDDYPYWIAHYYVHELEYTGSWDFWQYSDLGQIDGIRGDVDCNIYNGDLQQLTTLLLLRERDPKTGRWVKNK
ncbi:MAG: glycoside hydrolase family 25 protein [Bacteroidaceae bacterium]|nr:glycoside hydrolase family 25 protein [Bacteroidaceae bacterium]